MFVFDKLYIYTSTKLMNFFKNLRSNHGPDLVKNVRTVEKLERRIARHQNHLVFTLRCRDEKVVPPSLKLKCPIKTNNGHKIIEKAQTDLLRERVRVVNNKLDSFRQQKG